MEKHEYVSGEIFAMAGASLAHTRICSNLGRHIGNMLSNKNCDVLTQDLRVRTPDSRLFTYPNVVIVCGRPELEDEVQDTLLNPLVIFEVLSPTTEKWDRGEKFIRYRTIPTLQEYVLVSQYSARVEWFTREESTWRFREAVAEEAILRLDSLEIDVPLAQVFERVEFEPLEVPPTDYSAPH